MLNFSPPASPDAIAVLRRRLPTLPLEYFEFLARSNGAEGPLGVEPGWFALWAAEEVCENSDGYGLPIFLPGYAAVGSNGGGELLVFPLESNGSAALFMVPAIGMEPAAVLEVAPSFAAFEAAMGKDLA